MTVWVVLTIVFGALAAAGGAAAIVFLVLWLRTRGRLSALEESLRPAPRPTGAVHTAAAVARTVVHQAARLREHGVTQLLSESLEALVQWAKVDRERIVRVADADGIVTLFFSDIADSTALNESLGDEEWVRVLGAHDKVVRRQIAKHDGLVVKTIGDGFMAVFGRAESALNAALAVHAELQGSSDRRLRRTTLTLRIGIHTGTAITSGDDYLGRNVALCARIAAHAGDGCTLVSDDTRLAAGDAVGLQFTSEGHVAFKGIREDVEVFLVEAAPDSRPRRLTLGVHDPI